MRAVALTWVPSARGSAIVLVLSGDGVSVIVRNC